MLGNKYVCLINEAVSVAYRGEKCRVHGEAFRGECIFTMQYLQGEQLQLQTHAEQSDAEPKKSTLTHGK